MVRIGIRATDSFFALRKTILFFILPAVLLLLDLKFSCFFCVRAFDLFYLFIFFFFCVETHRFIEHLKLLKLTLIHQN